MRKVLIEECQLRRLFESEWNYHFGKEHDMRPYISDNKFRMLGRETGHFGSGTYFSTYQGVKGVEGYGESNPNKNPNFIKMGENIYRVDMDIYKNLYRVKSKKQGDILYTMMRNLNALFNRINDFGRFKPKSANYDNASLYQIISKNAYALGLKCPSYYELTRMAQKHGMNDDEVQSFSTLFMEWNGYNGVNVSGVEFYDNTKHGSVIYDLSKTDTNMEEVNPRSLFSGLYDSPYDDTIAASGYDDDVSDSLKGLYIGWYDKLNNMPINKAFRLLKNYTDSGNILGIYVIKNMNEELAKKYLMFLYTKNPRSRWGDSLIDELINDSPSSFVSLIERLHAYYWVNYESKKCYNNVLVKLLDKFYWKVNFDENAEELKKKYLNKLLSYMKRGLTEYEKEFINEEYFDGDESEQP